MTTICEKRAYDSFCEAQKIINAAEKIGRAYGKNKRRFAKPKPKRAYKCEICGKYHLTSQKKEKKQK